LLDIVTITLCAVICGADDWVHVATFGHAKERWLRTFLALPGGIRRTTRLAGCLLGSIRRNSDGAFCVGSLRWLARQERRSFAIDGKTLRGSHDRDRGTSALHLVSAWATASELVIARLPSTRSRTRSPRSLSCCACLSLEGSTVPIDAMGCQTAIAAQIVDQGADYVLTLKDNHPNLHTRVRQAFADADAATGKTLLLADLVPHERTEVHHDRLERRRCRVIGDPAYLAYIDPDRRWANLASVVCITSTRRVGGTTTTEDRHYLSSLPPDAAQLAHTIRRHWGIENRLHWVLDVAFHEDASSVRIGHAPENLARIRQLALNLIRQERSSKGSITTKRFRAALDESYLRSILDGLSA